MTSIRSGSLTESSKGGFSYAQAAKGRSPSTPSTKISSTAVSGTATPSSTAMSDLTPGSSWADDAEPNSNDPTTTPKPVGTTDGLTQTSVTDSPEADTNTTEVPATASSPDIGTASSVATSKEDDSSSNQNASSETTWDSKSAASDSAMRPASSKEGKTVSEESEETVKEPTPPKPTYHEAKPPSVNIWSQRAEALKAKAAAQSPATPNPIALTQNAGNDRQRADPRRARHSHAGPLPGSEQPLTNGKDFKKNGSGPRPQEDLRNGSNRRESRPEDATVAQRRAPTKAREHSHAGTVPPSVKNDTAWPKPTDAVDEEKKKVQEKDDKAEKERLPSVSGKAHGKVEWKVMPYTPTAVFETTMSGRGTGRMGRGGRGSANGTRGALHSSASAGDGHKPIVRTSSLPNGDGVATDPVEAAKADHEAMPPPPPSAKATRTLSDKPLVESQASETLSKAANAEEVSPSIVRKVAEAAPFTPSEHISRQQPATKRNKSPRKSENGFRRSGAFEETTGRRSSNAAQTEGTIDAAPAKETDGSATKPAFADRHQDPQSAEGPREGHQSYREGKRGGRRGGHRGVGNGHYSSSGHYSNGFSDYQGAPYGGPPSPFHPQRGNHFSQSGRNGYRNSNIRSQSIPMDAYGRPTGAYPGFQMMPQMPPFMPDYYSGFPGAQFPYAPTSERELTIASVASQIEYYFSIDNMVKDIFLRKHMDSQGFIFLNVIAEFNRLKQLTTDYDLLKSVCLQSPTIEIRIGDDGKDRLRKVEDWERWVMPMAERDPSAQNDGPGSVRRPSESLLRQYEQVPFYPHSPVSAGTQARPFQMTNGGPPPFFPSADPSYGSANGVEEARGRQTKPNHSQENGDSAQSNGFPMPPLETNGGLDNFPSSQIDSLTVVVRKHEVTRKRVPFHGLSSRTFSNGSIDSRNIMEEVSKFQEHEQASQANGETESNGLSSPSSSQQGLDTPDANALTLFWVKDKEAPVNIGSLPADTTHELYTHLRYKALSQREAAATGTCPYDLDVLYQFWSHFLIRNFNSQMYSEFRNLAHSDASERHNDTGLNNLIKYYSESLASQIPIRENVAHDYVELVKSESKADAPAFKRLEAAWRNGALNLKNRKKLGDMLDTSIKTKLDALDA